MNNDNAITLLNENGVKKEYGRIPDLWHVAQYLKGNIDADDLGLSSIADQILEVWHMAHDLKAVIEGQGDARVLEPGAAEPEFMIGDVDRVKNNLSYVIELARHRADMWQGSSSLMDTLVFMTSPPWRTIPEPVQLRRWCRGP